MKIVRDMLRRSTRQKKGAEVIHALLNDDLN